MLLASPPGASADILVADQQAFGGTGGVIRVNPLTGARSTLSANTSPGGGPAFVDPAGLAVAANGDILVVDPQAFPDAGGGVIRVNPVTGARTALSSNAGPVGGPPFVDPFGITLAPNGDILVTDQNAFDGGGGVIRVNPVTGARTAVSSNPAPPGAPTFDATWGIDVEPSGNIAVADAGAFAGGGGVIRVSPAGVRSTLSSNASPAGTPSFFDPIGLLVAPGGAIFVTEAGGGGVPSGVIGVNPLTGGRTTISANGDPPGGPSFGAPVGITLAAVGDLLVSGSTATSPGGAVIRVNPVTGARTRVSENGAPAGGPSFAFPTGLVDTGTPETAITGGPAEETRDHSPTFSFTSSRPGSTFTCSLDGVRTPCTSPFTAPSLDPGRHSFAVAATDADGNADPTPAQRQFVVLAVLADLPPPVLGRRVNVAPVRGTVKLALPAGSSAAGRARGAQKGLRFVVLKEARQIPVRSFLDTRRGTVRLVAAGPGRRQGDFASGLFQVLQARRGRDRGITELRLKGSSFRRCRVHSSRAEAKAARHRRSRRTVRRLRGNSTRGYRSRGRYAAATVRGTIWTTYDRCDGTLTRVTRGRVIVRDFRRKRNIRVRAGRSYLARARR